MADRPDGNLAQRLSNSIEFNWTPVDQIKPGERATPVARPGDVGRPADRTQPAGRGGTIELSYGDPQFDQKLWSGNYSTLKIRDFPPNTSVSSWVDDKGFFMWYNGGNDGKAHHYLPPGLKQIEVNSSVQNVDEMKLQASMAALREADGAKTGFASVNDKTDPVSFAKRMGGLGWDQLNMQEKNLRAAADQSPNNPYFRLYLADILVAEAFKPIMDQVASGKSRIDLNSPFTQRKLDEAAQQAVLAERIAQQYGGLRNPNTSMQPNLSPFHLNPYTYNPDMYWSGALYQGYRREAQVKILQAYIQQFSSVELPPNLPGK